MPAVTFSPIGNGVSFLNTFLSLLNGGFINTYQAGTSTPLATYTTNLGNVANTNPIVLNADGRAPQEIWLIQGSSYKLVISDALSNVIATYDNIAGIDGGLRADLANTTNLALGDALVGVKQPYSGAVGITQHAKNTEHVSVKDFGAIGDGATDDSAAFLAAGATGRQVYVPYTSTGYYLGTTAIPVITGQFWVGENMVTLKSASATACFLLQGYDQASGVRYFTIDMNTAPAGSTAIRFDTSVNVVWRVRINNIRIQNCYEAFGQVVAGPAYITDVTIEDISIILAKGRQIYFTLTRGSFIWNRINIDNTITGSALVTWASAQFKNFAGLELYNFDIAGQAAVKPQIYNASAVGLICDNGGAPAGTGFLWLRRVRVESSMGPGVQVYSSNFLYADTVESYASLGVGITLQSLTIGQFTNFYVRGAKDQAGKLAGAAGFYMESSTGLIGSSIAADSNDGAGVLIANCAGTTLSAVRSENSGTYGLQETGTANGNSVGGLYVNNNTSGGFALVNAILTGVTNAGVRQPDTSRASFAATKGGTDQTGIAPTTFTKVTYTTEILDPSNSYDAANSKWTPPPGNYRITATATITANVVAGSELTILIYKNGSAAAQSDVYPGASSGTTISVSRTLVANGTDFFEAYVYLAGAGNKTVGGSALQSGFDGSPV